MTDPSPRARPLPARGRLRALMILAALAAPQAGHAQQLDLVSRDQLRVCADPNNLPFSNDRKEGFENHIAELIGQDLRVPVSYVWFPQIVGFVRNTLRARRCDVVMGTASGDPNMETTNPYYNTGYMMVSRQGDGITATSVGDPQLADKKIGLIAATPPTDLLVRHHMMGQVTSYALVVDTRFDAPGRQMLQDLVDRKIDVGLIWGPIAGFYITHDHLPLQAAWLASEPDGPRLAFHISMGVRSGEGEWRRRLNQAIHTRQAEITQVLQSFGIPLLDEENHPITASAVATLPPGPPNALPAKSGAAPTQ